MKSPLSRLACLLRRFRKRTLPTLGTLLLSLTTAAGANTILAQDTAGMETPLSLAPHAWAVETARNELLVLDLKNSYIRYNLHTINAKGDVVRDVIETRDGPVARLVLRDGKPLSADDDSNEHTRLKDMLDDPAAFAKHIKSDQAGKKTAADLIKLLPEAMLFSYTPGQPQRPNATSPEVVLDYKPNPDWTPPTTISEALTGLEGRIWISPGSRRMTRLEVTVFRPINIGFGVLAHVNPGGTFTVEQHGVTGDRWVVGRFSEHVSLRALMVKSLHENTEVESSHIVTVPAMGYADAIRELLATPLPR